MFAHCGDLEILVAKSWPRIGEKCFHGTCLVIAVIGQSLRPNSYCQFLVPPQVQHGFVVFRRRKKSGARERDSSLVRYRGQSEAVRVLLQPLQASLPVFVRLLRLECHESSSGRFTSLNTAVFGNANPFFREELLAGTIGKCRTGKSLLSINDTIICRRVQFLQRRKPVFDELLLRDAANNGDRLAVGSAQCRCLNKFL